MKKFIDELKRRHVIRTASIYAITAWLIIQVAATTFPYLGFPKWAVQAVIIISIIGFPIMLLISWKYQMIPEDEEIQQIIPPLDDIGPNDEVTTQKQVKNKPEWALLAFVFVMGAIGTWFLLNRVNNGSQDNTLISVDRTAIMIFENATGIEEHEVIGKMISDWVTQGLIETGETQVVSSASIRQQIATAGFGMSNKKAVSEKLNAEKVIDGRYYVQGDNIIIQGRIDNVKTGETIHAFSPIQGKLNEALETVELFKQKVLGYWVNKNWSETSQDDPPTFNSYKHLIFAQDNWASDDSLVMHHLDMAIKEDDSFAEPWLLKVALLRNIGDYASADSVLSIIDQKRIDLSQKQKNLISFYQADLNGQNKLAYSNYKNEYEYDPLDFFVNNSMSIYSLLYVNNPQGTVDVIELIPNSKLDLENCAYCADRIVIQLMALNKLNRYKEALQIFDDIPDHLITSNMVKQALSACFFSNDQDQLDHLLNKWTYGELGLNQRKSFTYHLAQLYYLDDQKQKAADYANLGLDFFNSNNIAQLDWVRAELLNLADEHQAALNIYTQLRENQPNSRRYIYRSGLTYALMGNYEKALLDMDLLSEMKRDYDFGYIPYQKSRIYATLGFEAEAMDQLEISIKEGRQFYNQFFDGDLYLKSLHELPAFKKLLVRL